MCITGHSIKADEPYSRTTMPRLVRETNVCAGMQASMSECSSPKVGSMRNSEALTLWLAGVGCRTACNSHFRKSSVRLGRPAYSMMVPSPKIIHCK